MSGYLGSQVMPVDEKFDELLSGYIDDRLTPEERQSVEAALGEPAVSARLEQLRSVGEALRLLTTQTQQVQQSTQTPKRLPDDFALRVVAACKSLETKPVSNVVTTTPNFSVPENEPPALELSLNNGRWWLSGHKAFQRVAVLALGIASLLLLAVWLPQWLADPIQDSVPVADQSVPQAPSVEGSMPMETGLVAESRQPQEALGPEALEKDSVSNDSIDPGRMATDRSPIGQISFALVLDVELSQEARQQQSVQSLLEKYGIDTPRGLQPNARIEQAIRRMRFTVDEKPNVRPAEIYLIRASAPVLDAMLSEIQAEVEKFPAYRFDLAFQTPTLSLGQAIADAMEESDSLGESFALALADDSQAESTGAGFRPLSIEAIPHQGTLVSSNRRQDRIDSSIDLDNRKELSFLILLVR